MPAALLERLSNIRRVVVTLAVNPAFGWLVSRYRRRAFVNATYVFFALGLAAFYALLLLARPLGTPVPVRGS